MIFTNLSKELFHRQLWIEKIDKNYVILSSSTARNPRKAAQKISILGILHPFQGSE